MVFPGKQGNVNTLAFYMVKLGYTTNQMTILETNCTWYAYEEKKFLEVFYQNLSIMKGPPTVIAVYQTVRSRIHSFG